MRSKTEERTYFPWSVKEPLLKETGGVCAHCGVSLDRYTNLTVDHIIPLSKGGKNDPENLTVLCEDCNEKKSDMVISPGSWYPYLPKSRKKALDRLISDYMLETDYLAEDCLMPLDIFRLEIPVETKKKMPNGYTKVIRMPAYLQGSKMTDEEAFAWLTDYKRTLLYRDHGALVTHPSQLPAPCYRIRKGNRELAVVLPWMLHKYDQTMKTYRNEIFFDWYFSPDLPDKEYLPDVLAGTVEAVKAYAYRSLAASMKKGVCITLTHIRCVASDRFREPVFRVLKSQKERAYQEDMLTDKENRHLPARICDLVSFSVAGSTKSCEAVRKRFDACFGDPTSDVDLEKFGAICKEFNQQFLDTKFESGESKE